MGACFSKARRASPCPDLPPELLPDLPPELLGLILCRLSSYADRLSFRAVCHQWRLAAQQQHKRLPPALPWLHQSFGTYQSLPDGRLHRFAMPPQPCRSSCCHDRTFASIRSFGSWVLYEHYDLHRYRCTLRNPFSGATIQIPSRSDNGHEWYLHRSLPKLVVCSSDLMAAIVFGPSGVGFFRPGAPSWSLSPADSHLFGRYYKDIAFLHGNLYAISTREGLYLHDPELARPVEHVIKTPPPATKFSELPCDSRSFDRHLVVSSSGKLLMVRWGIDPPTLDVNHQTTKRAIDHAIKLDVFEADLEKNRWSEVKDLGDQILFISRRCSRSICSSYDDERFQGNRVFISGLDWAKTAFRAHDAFDKTTLFKDAPSYFVYDIKNGTVSPVLLNGSPPADCIMSEWLFPCD